jgi:hypothetical protein
MTHIKKNSIDRIFKLRIIWKQWSKFNFIWLFWKSFIKNYLKFWNLNYFFKADPTIWYFIQRRGQKNIFSFFYFLCKSPSLVLYIDIFGYVFCCKKVSSFAWNLNNWNKKEVIFFKIMNFDFISVIDRVLH